MGKNQHDDNLPNLKFSSLLPQNIEKKKEKPYKYIFGRGQSDKKQLFKDVSLESGVYILFIQAEVENAKIMQEQMRFWVNIYAQSLVQILKQPQIYGFQKAVYESAIL